MYFERHRNVSKWHPCIHGIWKLFVYGDITLIQRLGSHINRVARYISSVHKLAFEPVIASQTYVVWYKENICRHPHWNTLPILVDPYDTSFACFICSLMPLFDTNFVTSLLIAVIYSGHESMLVIGEVNHNLASSRNRSDETNMCMSSLTVLHNKWMWCQASILHTHDEITSPLEHYAQGHRT